MTFNDMLVMWSSSETYVGNLCFVDEQPCMVTALWPVPYQGLDPELQDTGFGEHPLDGFGWDCKGCTPTPEDPCGVVEPR